MLFQFCKKQSAGTYVRIALKFFMAAPITNQNLHGLWILTDFHIRLHKLPLLQVYNFIADGLKARHTKNGMNTLPAHPVRTRFILYVGRSPGLQIQRLNALMRCVPSRACQWIVRAFCSRSRGRLLFGPDLLGVVKPFAFPLRLF